MAWYGSEFEESMPNTHTQTTSHNLLLQTYMCAAELATWGVGPDVDLKRKKRQQMVMPILYFVVSYGC